MHSAEWHLSPVPWLLVFPENRKHTGFDERSVAGETYKRATAAAVVAAAPGSGSGRPGGCGAGLGERVFTLTPGARPVCCATVFMSILLCCCNFLFAPFSPFINLHIGVQSGKAVAFVGGVGGGVGGWLVFLMWRRKWYGGISVAGWIILQPRTPTLLPPPQPRGQWGLKLLLFFRPGRQDDKDSIPLGLLTPGCTAEVENGRQWGWGGDQGLGSLERVGVGWGRWAGVLIQKINPMEFYPRCKWRFVAFCHAILGQSHRTQRRQSMQDNSIRWRECLYLRRPGARHG